MSQLTNIHSCLIRVFALSAMSVSLWSCSSTPERYLVPSAQLSGIAEPERPRNDEPSGDIVKRVQFEKLNTLQTGNVRLTKQTDLSNAFVNGGELAIAVDQLKLEAFIHTVFGELLAVNYVINAADVDFSQTVSLQLQKPMSARQLFVVTRELLAARGVSISEREGTYYIHKTDETQKDTALGYGRRPADVPDIAGVITQIIPVRYNRDIALERVLRDLTNAKIEELQGQSAYTVQGERREILRVLELMDILDAPSVRGRHVGLLRLTYISINEFLVRLQQLMESEGLPIDLTKAANRNMVAVPLEQIGAIALFAADEAYLSRARYWATQLDQPKQGDDMQYYLYHPRFARAADLGASVSALLGQSNTSGTPLSGNQSRDTATAGQTQLQQGRSTTQGSGQISAQGNERNLALSMTVDERTNSLIFYAKGLDYQKILPMIKRLDVMPKQILLEATIAEVSLTDEFKFGVEFALKNGKYELGTKGAFGANKLGGLAFNYVSGVDSALANMLATDSRTNLLSRPSLVVRDGVSANLSVGIDIPTAGQTTINPGTETESTTVVYRKTGVQLTVRPTISAQGLVVLEIEQTVSSAEDGGISVAGNPSISERALRTEVIAQSGQPVLLAGMMQNNSGGGASKVPVLGDIPLLGNLFKSQNRNNRKTELVILITPKVIEDNSQWQSVRDKLSTELKLMQVLDGKSSN